MGLGYSGARLFIVELVLTSGGDRMACVLRRGGLALPDASAPFDLYTFQPIRLVAPRCVVSLLLLILAPVTRAPLSLGSVLAGVVFG